MMTFQPIFKESLKPIIQESLKHTRNFSSTIFSKRVVITGLGVVSPVGCNVTTAWNTIRNAGCGIVKLGPEYDKMPSQVAAIIPKEQLPTNMFSKSDLKIMSKATQYALIATKEAVESSKIDLNACQEKCGVSIGSSMLDLTDIIQTNEDFKKGYKYLSPFFVPRILLNMAAGQISIKYGLRGPNHTVSTACATGAHAIGDAFRMIKNGDADVMVCGATDAFISPLSLASFCRMKALATKFNENPSEASRPFDDARDGFVMAEGAAVMILEDLNHALSRNATIYAEINGYGLSGDGSHITAPREDASGALLAMKMALKEADLKPNDVDYINAHATSTPLGDAIEAKAIQTLFEGHVKNVRVSSTKGAHGHLLGAAGSLEAVFTVKAIYEKLLPPTINLKNSSIDLNFVANKSEEYNRDRIVALKNSFGFGGTNASLCFSSYL